MLSRFGGLVAALAVLLGVTSPSAAASRTAPPQRQSGSPLVVCGLTSLSGPYQLIGEADVTGWRAYAKWIDSRGGILGHPVSLVIENDGSQPSLAAALVRKCVTQDHASFIVGPGGTADSAAAVPVANALHVVDLDDTVGWHNLGLSNAELHSYAFPGIYNAFLLDDLDVVTRLIVPRHYTRVAVLQESDPGGRLNATYMKRYGRQHHFKVVAAQTVTTGSTDDTPQVLNLLAAHPQIIVLGLAPGPDTITALKAVRAQSAEVPVAECMGCAQPAFFAAAGGASVMHNVYVLGPVESLLHSLGGTEANRGLVSQINSYISALTSAGYGSTEDINGSESSWVAMEELTAAIMAAHSTSAKEVRDALEHQHLNTFGISWARSPANHARMKSVVDVMGTWTANGQFRDYGGATTVPISRATAEEM
jgi:ABC-type branched-subunit amino acid transport system substrate-binding protein